MILAYSLLICSFLSNVYAGLGLMKPSISSSISKCEFNALRFATEFGDVFNAAAAHEIDTMERLYQDFIVKNLGFANYYILKGVNGTGRTWTGSSTRDLQEKGKWTSKLIQETPYAVLENKWIYMIGDSTTRQVWAAYAAPFQDSNFAAQAKEYTRHYCLKQEHRTTNQVSEGWTGPCQVNEVTCHVPGYGKEGVLSFDWKHFPWEGYDEYFWGPEGPWIRNFKMKGDPDHRRPDLITIQTGLHTCHHAHHENAFLNANAANRTLLAEHEKGVWKLMSSIRHAIDAPFLDQSTPSKKNPTTVIFLTSGAAGFPGTQSIYTDACVTYFNRVITEAAHAFDFAVLDRGEIERRFLYKTDNSFNPYLLRDMHLGRPVPEVIATTLLHLYTCVDKNALSTSRTSSALNPLPHHLVTGYRNVP